MAQYQMYAPLFRKQPQLEQSLSKAARSAEANPTSCAGVTDVPREGPPRRRKRASGSAQPSQGGTNKTGPPSFLCTKVKPPDEEPARPRRNHFQGSSSRLTDLLARALTGPPAAAPRSGTPRRGEEAARIGASRSTNSAASENVQPPLALTRLTQIRGSPARCCLCPRRGQHCAAASEASSSCPRVHAAALRLPAVPVHVRPAAPAALDAAHARALRPARQAPARARAQDRPGPLGPLPGLHLTTHVLPRACYRSRPLCSWNDVSLGGGDNEC